MYEVYVAFFPPFSANEVMKSSHLYSDYSSSKSHPGAFAAISPGKRIFASTPLLRNQFSTKHNLRSFHTKPVEKKNGVKTVFVKGKDCIFGTKP
jgi:hypothetical protein